MMVNHLNDRLNMFLFSQTFGDLGVTMLEEGFLSDKRVALRTTDYFTIAKNDVDKVATNVISIYYNFVIFERNS